MSATAAPVPRAGVYLTLLVVINLFNYLDRQVLAAVLPDIQQDGTIFPPSDTHAEAKAGWLGSAFLVSYMLFSPLFGWLDGHRYRRWVILGLGVCLWSLASGSTGLVQSYWLLLMLRCLIGVGEGAYGPVASAMIADMYPPAKRGMPMAVFNMAIPVGSALGYLVGAAVSGLAGGWRPAFWVTFSGLALGLVCFLQKEPPRQQVAAGPVPGYFKVLTGLMRNRSFALGCLGMTAITFVIGGVAFWSPTYLFQREAKFQFTDSAIEQMTRPKPEGPGVPVETAAKLRPLADGTTLVFTQVREELRTRLTDAESTQHAEAIYKQSATEDSPKSSFLTIVFGGMIVLGGLAATVVGTWLGERLRPRVPGAYFWVSAGGALFSLPFFLGFIFLPLPWGWPCVFLAVFGLFLHTGPAFTLLANVTRSDERATAFAINILVIHALGDVISPPLMGEVARLQSLQAAFLGLTAFILLGVLLWVAGVKFLANDTAKAEEATPPTADSAAPPTP